MIEILHGDCRDFSDLVDGFDVMIADPPYRSYVHDSAFSVASTAVALAQDGSRSVQRDLGFACLDRALRTAIAGWTARVKKWSLIYSDMESTNVWRHSCQAARIVSGQKGEAYIRPIPWIRWSMPQISGDRPTSGCEMISVYWGSQEGRKSWHGPGNLIAHRHQDEDAPPVDELLHKRIAGKDKHKTQKPLDQALDLVSWFSDEGDIVWDPTMGRGTTALACAILGRNFVGCEIDGHERDLAQARVTAFERLGVAGLSDRDRERHARFMVSHKELLAAKADAKATYAAQAEKRAARAAMLEEINVSKRVD